MTSWNSRAFDELMAIRACPDTLDDEISVRGADPFYRSPLRMGEAITAVVAATGVAINDIWALRGHPRQKIAVSLPEAAASLRTVIYTQSRNEDGTCSTVPLPPDRAHVMQLCRPYRTRDGRWFTPHFSLDLGAKVLKVLGCDDTVESVSEAVARWDADDLEEAIAQAGACGGVVRTRDEWLAHPHGAYLASRAAVQLTRVGESEPEAFYPGDRPLSGVRVLDLTRIVAGPIVSRGLVEHGADVLMVTSQDLLQAPEHLRDTSPGKRSCFLDLKTPQGVAELTRLVQEADVVVNSFRPGALDALGFGTKDLVRMRPGMVVVNVSCYGYDGPFAKRRGWEQIAQTVTGLSDAHGMALEGSPQIITPLVCDFTTGCLGTYGALLALGRRAREGGSWQVEVSLCRSAMFIQEQGLLAEFDDAPEELTAEQLSRRQVPMHSDEHGDLMMLGPVLELSQTPSDWGQSLPRLGEHDPVWLAR